MKPRSEQTHKQNPPVSAAIEKNPEWWKVNHPHSKAHGSTAFTTNVKTTLWKTFNVRSSGKK
jgi:hypothetical protein